MKIGVIYNTPVRLERGDRIAVDKHGKLWIKVGNSLYASSKPVENLDSLQSDPELNVHSAGFYSTQKRIMPEMDWVRYPRIPQPRLQSSSRR